MLMMNDIMEYKENKNFNYFVIESSHGEYYGFNLKVKKKCSYATKIVSPDERDDFMVVEWKVVKRLPKWIRNANSCIDFISGKEDNENEQGAPPLPRCRHRRHAACCRAAAALPPPLCCRPRAAAAVLPPLCCHHHRAANTAAMLPAATTLPPTHCCCTAAIH